MGASSPQASARNPVTLPPPLDVIPARAWAPDRRDAWWTLYLPLVVLAGVLLIHAVAREFYLAHVLPEGFGFLELSQFFLALAASVLSARALRLGVVKGSTLLWIAMVFFALAAFYVDGEEHRWGQNFLNWNTPSYWSEINRQQETNLHNTSAWFNQRPKLVFDVAMFIGGLLVPFVQIWTGPFRRPLLALLTPTLAIAPAALIALAFKAVDDLGKGGMLGEMAFSRPSEVVETFQYAYMLFYVVVLSRRLEALEAAGVRKVTL